MLTIFTTIMSLITILVMWLAGNNDKRAWLLGLANQVLWVIFIIMTGSWGLLLLTGSLVVVYIRNLRKWEHGPYTHSYKSYDDIMDYLSVDDERWNYEDDGREA